ncbi:hypothetical protein [Micromonospora sp. KC723]|uniref:hypothetical protein n=1 Tax=Micromonospora sp. KC723 TaxID=2530381 RepID=UPI001050C385|nr:hypothetical protein [Micromonospora sp. KC723]TDB77824.1 hypothetical protein E1165_02715 [Micromonospora sp. KC723]
MPAVAFTNPLWWVTRWACRLLTSFAVAVALSLGGTVVPDGVTFPPGPAPVAPPLFTGPPVPVGSALAVAPPGPAWSPTAAAPTAAVVPGGEAAARHHAASEIPPAAPLPVGPAVAMPDAPAATGTGELPGRAGATPAASGPRAPPVA